MGRIWIISFTSQPKRSGERKNRFPPFCFFFCLVWSNFQSKLSTFYLNAAQLPIILSVHFFFNRSLHLHLCNVCFEHKIPYGWPWNSLEGNERVTTFSGTNGLLLHFPLVCWRAYLLPLVSYRHKPGQFASIFFGMWRVLLSFCCLL